MKTIADLEIASELDHEHELEIIMVPAVTWINEESAMEVINYLSKVFEFSDTELTDGKLNE